MKKTDKRLLGGLGVAVLLVAVLFNYPDPRTPLVQISLADIEPAAGQPYPAPAPAPAAVTPPAAVAPKAVEKVVVAPVTPVPAPEAAPVLDIDAQTEAEMKTKIATEFVDKLSFPLDEAKMVAFVRLANKVKSVNDRWDVLVASADTDKMAIEYNNLAVNEITNALKSSPSLTLDQYNELTKLTSTNTEFNQLYMAYREMLAEAAKPKVALPAGGANLGLPVIVNGQIAPASQPTPSNYGQPLPIVGQPAVSTQPMPATRQSGTGQPAPVLPPVAATPSTTPVAVPAGSGNAQAPQG